MTAAFDLNDPATFPSRRTEAWKYSDVRRYMRDAPPPSPPGRVEGGGPFYDLGGDGLVFVNGRAVGADAYVAFGDHTLRLRFVSDASRTGHTATARISARPGSTLLLLESHEGHGVAYAAHNRLSIDVPSGAAVHRIVLTDEPADSLSITQAEVTVGEGAVYHQTLIATGGRLQRLETQVHHAGHGADVRLDGLYRLTDSRHVDLTSVVTHAGPDGLTSQLAKGVVTDTARGVFQGRIVVERGADGTDARMGHHALILSDRGEVDAKPELIIYADDVQCAHGNTVGALDETALFYMQQRGLSAEEARALLTEAFLMEVVDRIDHEGAREEVRAWLTERS
ncbi:Fe-S cluster assembly protein SufD [Brevundimonas poindexterae]|uniref:Fe-S cluster assembly protein SufD n=1 Tax=Brevundimonas poindexterae TaxID=74325 RepID=UPI001CFCFFD4|nr:Fe-S cluster assembly protein SufD [Brevundimonas poindexterae]